jgi:hypothetical protein
MCQRATALTFIGHSTDCVFLKNSAIVISAITASVDELVKFNKCVRASLSLTDRLMNYEPIMSLNLFGHRRNPVRRNQLSYFRSVAPFIPHNCFSPVDIFQKVDGLCKFRTVLSGLLRTIVIALCAIIGDHVSRSSRYAFCSAYSGHRFQY